MSTRKADDKERSDVVSNANNKTVRKPGALKTAFDKSQKQNHRSEHLTGRKQSTSTLRKTTTKSHDNEGQENLEKEDHVLKKGTVLIMGDSILNSIDKKKIGKNSFCQSAMLPRIHYFRFAFALHATPH